MPAASLVSRHPLSSLLRGCAGHSKQDNNPLYEDWLGEAGNFSAH